MTDSEVAVIGGGIVGMSVAYGLLKKGIRVTVFDGSDSDLRASRGNFGLIWVQGKGDSLPEYARWTLQSAKLWPEFAKILESDTGIDIELQQRGGFYLCLDKGQLEKRASVFAEMRETLSDYPFEVLNPSQLCERMPGVGKSVVGATYCPLDGHINPLLFFRALHEAFIKLGGKLVNGVKIQSLGTSNGLFQLRSESQTWSAGKVVLAAGLGNRQLARQVGLNAPVSPNRGQVLVSERATPLIHYPTGHIRQTGEGSIQLGDSNEDVGFDDSTTVEEMQNIAVRAVKMFPAIGNLRLIRAWGALRVISDDGFPIYQESNSSPGAFVVTCHSGVTLAAIHAGPLADWISGAEKPENLHVFSGDRFNV